MQCSFCGKELMAGQECNCSMYQEFKNQQAVNTPPVAAPKMSPPPAPPKMTPPPAPPMNNQTQQTPPPMYNQTQQTPPPMYNQAQQTPPPMYNQAQQAPPPMYNQAQQANGATNNNTSSGNVQVNINLEEAKAMTKQAGKKMSAFWYHVKKMLGVGNSAEDNGADPFERGKQIVPEISNCCEGEIPVKQYRVANFRSRLQGLWAEGKIQVTNKRVIFRAAGRSILGKTTLQQEYIIDEIAGIDISNGIRVDFFELLLALVLGYPLTGLITFKFVMAFLQMNEFIGIILAIALAVVVLAPFVLLKGYLLLKALGSFSAALIFMALQYKGSFFQLLFFIFVIISFIVLFLFSLRPSVSVAIMSKAGTGTPVSMRSPSHFKLESAREMLPAEDIDIVQKEIGAIISDIQKFGDYGIEKWKV